MNSINLFNTGAYNPLVAMLIEQKGFDGVKAYVDAKKQTTHHRPAYQSRDQYRHLSRHHPAPRHESRGRWPRCDQRKRYPGVFTGKYADAEEIV